MKNLHAIKKKKEAGDSGNKAATKRKKRQQKRGKKGDEVGIQIVKERAAKVRKKAAKTKRKEAENNEERGQPTKRIVGCRKVRNRTVKEGCKKEGK